MGCAQSRIDNEESVSRCKERRNLMREAVVARNAFAAGHCGYVMALKNTGAALSDYGHGESLPSQEQLLLHHQQQPLASTATEPPPPPPPPLETLPPPPPPLPTFTPSPPIKRASSLPTMPTEARKTRMQGVRLAIAEEDEEEEEEEEGFRRRSRNVAGEMGAAANATGSSSPMTPGMKAVPPPESKGAAWDYFFMVDDNMAGHTLSENEEGEEFGDDENVEYEHDDEPKTPEKAEEIQVKPEEIMASPVTPATIEHSKTAPPDFQRMVMPGFTLMDILNQIDDHFLKASESAQEVSKMLEATRLHYHSNFADNRGHIDHSARVMRVITWNRSFRGIPNGDGAKEEDSDDYETHATVLDKLLAWEKKLFDEVKQGEHMKVEYQRKVALLNKQKKRNASAETLEKTKAAVSHLHTRYIVDMQSMDSTVSEVNQIRDEQLYPKLVSLADAMGKMWEDMSAHHNSQLKIVLDLKALDIAHTPMETTKHHHERTEQLYNVVQHWYSEFEKLVLHQKQYIQALNSWLKLNLVPIESSLKEKISSPPRVQRPPIQPLLHAWHDFLEKLPDELAKSATSSFAAVIKTILLHQEEEMKLKEQYENTRKEFLRKNQAFDDWYQKYMLRKGPGEADQDRSEDANHKDPVAERQFAVESLKKKMEEEAEAHQRHCIQVREKSLGSLKTRLPELFRAMSDYSQSCADNYGKLRFITTPQASNGNSHV
ncbi:protein ROLLING AND ERECT LEAF 2-like [Argentina anserina]|uniref:protein ROLLING AND ERECT LEAF 2-like n=1 Tax=Argentina anserina TaxID=57926 RepID=UPI0021768BBD|nr:protein ROLLING AND ERECT LEAF 2-like [Potentilla anserina]